MFLAFSLTELSVPDHVIQRFSDMAREEGAPVIKKGNAEPFATVVDDSLFPSPSFDDVLQIADEDELLVAPVSSEPVIDDVNITPNDGLPDEVPLAPDVGGAAISPAIGEPLAEYTDYLTDDVPPDIDGEESATFLVGGEPGDNDVEIGDSDTEITSIHTTGSKSENATADDATTDEPIVTGYEVDLLTSPNSEEIEDTTNHGVTIDAPCDEVCKNDVDSVFPPPQEAEQVAKQRSYNLRPTTARDYTHLGHTQFVAEPTSTYGKLVTKLF